MLEPVFEVNFLPCSYRCPSRGARRQSVTTAGELTVEKPAVSALALLSGRRPLLLPDGAEDFGLRRFTMARVARRVGVSRVTVYRYLPKKDQLINALIMRELRRFLTKPDAVIEAEPTSEAKLVQGVLFCLKTPARARLLNQLLRTEPELILLYLTTKAGTVLVPRTS